VRPRVKVTTESLQELEVVYEKSIGTKINDLDRLEVVSRSRQPLRDIFDVEYLGNR